MTDLAIPEAADGVDVFIAFVVPQQRHVAAHHVDERVGGWFRKGVKKIAWHVTTVRQRSLARD